MYPATLTPWAAISLGVTQAALAALPASQLFVTKEDRGRVWRDFRVRGRGSGGWGGRQVALTHPYSSCTATIYPAPPRPALQRLPHTLRSAVWLRKPTLPGALYLVLSLAFAGSGLAYLLAPKVGRAAGERRAGCVALGRLLHSIPCLTPPLFPSVPRPAATPQTTLYHVFGYAYGKSTALAWRSTGAGLATVLAAMCYTLKVGGGRGAGRQREAGAAAAGVPRRRALQYR